MLRHMQKRMASALAIAALVVGAADVAKAVGTLAGTSVTNTATVNYSVNAVVQPALTANAAFVVDRRIDLTVTALPVTFVDVTPGTNGAIPFTLSNTSNAPLNFNLAATNVANPFAGADNFDPTTNNVFVDSNANSVYDVGVDTATTVDTLANDTSVTVFIVSAIPGGQAGGSIAGVAMTATARETTANGGGAVANDNAIADVAATVQTVFADGAGPYDAVRDAAFSDDGAFRVLGANVTVTKAETVLSDPINLAVNPKHIPGASVRYTVTVSNTAAGPTAVPATTVTVTDPLPAGVTYTAASIVVGGVGQTDAADADMGSFAAGTVTVAIPSLAPGASSVITFQVTVN